MVKKIADELAVPVDYLTGGSVTIMLDKKTMKRIEDMEALPAEEKDKVYSFINMAMTHPKTKKSFC